MRQLAIISGKGGTGKTTIAASLAVLAQKAVIADCDVEAPNLAMLLRPKVLETHDFSGLSRAVIDSAKCQRCGECVEVCRSGAIHDFAVDHLSCNGCGVCYHICPRQAIVMQPCVAGQWFVSDTAFGPMVHARLEPGEENSGKLVSIVRAQARDLAGQGANTILIDGPPGIGCPVIASLTGVSRVLIVTEPTLSGISDLKRVLDLCRHFSVVPLVCVNRYDLSPANTRLIENWCAENGIRTTVCVPHDPEVVHAIAQGVPVVECSNGPAALKLRQLWNILDDTLDHETT